MRYLFHSDHRFAEWMEGKRFSQWDGSAIPPAKRPEGRIECFWCGHEFTEEGSIQNGELWACGREDCGGLD